MNEQLILSWIDSQRPSMLDVLKQWSRMNSHSFNHAGLIDFSRHVKNSFSLLGADFKEIVYPAAARTNAEGKKENLLLAPGLFFTKRPSAKKQVILMIHLDTVYERDSDFQDVKEEGGRLLGPGVADAKGGVMVMLKALEAFEKSPEAQHVGWRVFLNTDEEIGSPGSGQVLQKLSDGCQIAMLYEPSLPDGKLVGKRKGSGNFTVYVKGRAAHAGRAIGEGRNAIHALNELLVRLQTLHEYKEGMSFNCGVIQGGVAANVVPAQAYAQFNIRIKTVEHQKYCEELITNTTQELEKKFGVTIAVDGGFHSPPKPLIPQVQKMLDGFIACASSIGFSVGIGESGGVCDGNRLQSYGIPAVDSLGVSGGCLHSENEYCEIATLTERVKLSTMFLLRWAKGEWDIE